MLWSTVFDLLSRSSQIWNLALRMIKTPSVSCAQPRLSCMSLTDQTVQAEMHLDLSIAMLYKRWSFMLALVCIVVG